MFDLIAKYFFGTRLDSNKDDAYLSSSNNSVNTEDDILNHNTDSEGAAYRNELYRYGKSGSVWYRNFRIGRSYRQRIANHLIDGQPVATIIADLDRYEVRNPISKFFIRLFTSIETKRELLCYYVAHQLDTNLDCDRGLFRQILNKHATFLPLMLRKIIFEVEAFFFIRKGGLNSMLSKRKNPTKLIKEKIQMPSHKNMHTTMRDQAAVQATHEEKKLTLQQNMQIPQKFYLDEEFTPQRNKHLVYLEEIFQMARETLLTAANVTQYESAKRTFLTFLYSEMYRFCQVYYQLHHDHGSNSNTENNNQVSILVTKGDLDESLQKLTTLISCNLEMFDQIEQKYHGNKHSSFEGCAQLSNLLIDIWRAINELSLNIPEEADSVIKLRMFRSNLLSVLNIIGDFLREGKLTAQYRAWFLEKCCESLNSQFCQVIKHFFNDLNDHHVDLNSMRAQLHKFIDDLGRGMFSDLIKAVRGDKQLVCVVDSMRKQWIELTTQILRAIDIVLSEREKQLIVAPQHLIIEDSEATIELDGVLADSPNDNEQIREFKLGLVNDLRMLEQIKLTVSIRLRSVNCSNLLGMTQMLSMKGNEAVSLKGIIKNLSIQYHPDRQSLMYWKELAHAAYIKINNYHNQILDCWNDILQPKRNMFDTYEEYTTEMENRANLIEVVTRRKKEALDCVKSELEKASIILIQKKKNDKILKEQNAELANIHDKVQVQIAETKDRANKLSLEIAKLIQENPHLVSLVPPELARYNPTMWKSPQQSTTPCNGQPVQLSDDQQNADIINANTN